MKRSRDGECPECLRGGTCIIRNPRPAKMSMPVDDSWDVTRRIERVFKEGFMSDVTLIVGGKPFPAHRLLLSASSPVFETMFSSRWQGEQMSRVELKENTTCEKVFHLFLTYVYTGRVQIEVLNVLPLLMLADKYVVEELMAVCFVFMDKHIAQAVVNNMFFSWLQYTEAAGHKILASQCKNFALWNLDILINSTDLPHLEPEQLIDLLKQNDLVVESEFKLFEFVVKWLEMRNVISRTKDGNGNAACQKSPEEMIFEDNLVKSLMEHIRFPMMEPNQLERLPALPIVLRYKDYFMWRLGVGMSYQGGNQDQADRLVHMMGGTNKSNLFTPRLYMANIYSLQVEMEEIHNQPPYVSRTYCFSSRTHLAAEASPRDENMTDWVIDFYPRGVFFGKFFVIVWQGLLECPERNKDTVRMRLTCQGPHFPLSVKVGVCVYRTVATLEHVSNVTETMLTFERKNDTRNIDDIVDFNELSMAVDKNEIINLKMRLIIMPMDKYCSTDLRVPSVRRISGGVNYRKIAS